jgi:uncharacterized protein YggE
MSRTVTEDVEPGGSVQRLQGTHLLYPGASPAMRALPAVLAVAASVPLAAVAVLATWLAPGVLGSVHTGNIGAVQAQPAPASTASAPPGMIQTAGTGQMLAAPDVAYVTLGVQATGDNAQDATNKASTTMAATLSAVKSQGIADNDVQTDRIALDPVFADKQTNQITGYRASQTVSVTVDDLGSVSRVLDAGVQAGSNSSLSIRFSIKAPTALQEQALVSAVQQATGKASAIAGAAGLRLTGAYNLSESNVQVVERLASSAADAAPAPSVPVQAGRLVVSANVQASFSYSR